MFLKLQYIFNTRLSTVNRVHLSSTWKHYYLSSFTDTYHTFVLNSNRAYYYYRKVIERAWHGRGSVRNKSSIFESFTHTSWQVSQEDEIIFIAFNYELILFLYIIFSYSPAIQTRDININILNRKEKSAVCVQYIEKRLKMWMWKWKKKYFWMFSLSKNSSQSIGNRLSEEIALLERALIFFSCLLLKTLIFFISVLERSFYSHIEEYKKKFMCGVWHFKFRYRRIKM